MPLTPPTKSLQSPLKLFKAHPPPAGPLLGSKPCSRPLARATPSQEDDPTLPAKKPTRFRRFRVFKVQGLV